jgi:signal peptidase I
MAAVARSPLSLSTFDDHARGLRRPASSADPEEALSERTTLSAEARPYPKSKRVGQGKALLWEIAQTVLLTVAIFLAVRLVVQNFRVEGASMDPTLQSGQFLLINKVAYARVDGTPFEVIVPSSSSRAGMHYVFGGPSRGDIIVFHHKPSGKEFIKRVIGLPGETVKIQDGRVYVNGVQVEEPYIEHRATYDLDSKRIPSNEFFVLGDNRPNSSDSHLGWFVPAESIVGRAWVSYWPPNRWGVVQPATYPN